MAETAVEKKTFHREIVLRFKGETSEVLHLKDNFVVLKIGHCGKYIRST
jgi:hypothetical protein